MFVTAAAGARDGYQIPTALYESGQLASHVTDFYTPDILINSPFLNSVFSPRLQNKIRKRNTPLLPSKITHSSFNLVFQKIQSGRFSGNSVPVNDQDIISTEVLRIARRREANLLVYAGYGHKAFVAEPRSERLRGLVQYHPHISLSANVLKADLKKYPVLSNALEAILRDEKDKTNIAELEIADFIICCSSFTSESCQYVGIPSSKISVIPYGIDFDNSDACHEENYHERTGSVHLKFSNNLDSQASGPFITNFEMSAKEPRVSSSICHFLFVGSGIHRKGLHHLLVAWKRAGLRHSKLIIVNRYVDPQIRTNFDPGENVYWETNILEENLIKLYQTSAAFVMPSLIEGFGYVYLEAMSRGCYCIGTTNTGLPDILGSEKHGVCINPGDIDELISALKETEERFFSTYFNRHEIQENVKRFTWPKFRSDIRAALPQH